MLNVHFHSLFLDGVYTRPLLGEPEFRASPPLTDAEVAELSRVLHHRILRWLRKQGRLPEMTEADDSEHDSQLATCYSAAVQGRIAFGDKAGAWVRRVGRSEPDDGFELVPPQVGIIAAARVKGVDDCRKFAD